MDKVFRFINMITMGNKGFTLEILICEIMFSFPSKFRKWKWKPLSYIIAVLAVVVHFAAGFPMPLFKVPGLAALLIFAVSVLMQCIVFDTPVNRILFNSVAAYAVQNLAVNSRSFVLYFLPLRVGAG